MRHSLFIVLAVSFLGFGCSSHAKKDTMDKTNAPATDPKILEKSADKTAAKATSGAASAASVECSVKGDVRKIEVRSKDAGCEVGYTKFGKEGIVATSAKGLTHCEQTSEKIQNKLKGSGYSCK